MLSALSTQALRCLTWEQVRSVSYKWSALSLTSSFRGPPTDAAEHFMLPQTLCYTTWAGAKALLHCRHFLKESPDVLLAPRITQANAAYFHQQVCGYDLFIFLPAECDFRAWQKPEVETSSLLIHFLSHLWTHAILKKKKKKRLQWGMVFILFKRQVFTKCWHSKSPDETAFPWHKASVTMYETASAPRKLSSHF